MIKKNWKKLVISVLIALGAYLGYEVVIDEAPEVPVEQVQPAN